MVARRLSSLVARALRPLSSPILAAVLASGLTALMMGGPPEIETIREVRVVERIPGQDRVTVVTRYVCRGKVNVDAASSLSDASGDTGKARVDDASSLAESGDVGASQRGEAVSGSIHLGQFIDIDSSCSTVNVTADSVVSDVKARTGSAEVRNEAEVNAPSASPSPSPTPSPQSVDTPLPTPTPSPTPVTTSTPELTGPPL